MTDKTLVFLIHGMGTHKAKWSKSVQEALQCHASGYEFFKKSGNKNLTKFVEFVEIVYDDIFTNALKNWEEKNKELLQQVATADKAQAEKAVYWLKGMKNGKNNFAWTHAVDVLLWRFSSYFRNSIKAKISAKMTRKLIESAKKNSICYAKAAVISHSLGTSVMHDVLANLAFGRYLPAHMPNGFDPKAFRFMSLHTIANVSKILELDDYPVYCSRVRPGSVDNQESYCQHFFNYHNTLDPFTLPRPFRPPWPPDTFHDKQVSHLHGANPHSIEHYLLNPKVHVPLLRSIVGVYEAVTPKEEEYAYKAFKNVDLSEEVKTRIEQKINNAREVMGLSVDMIDLVKGIQLFFGD